MSDQAEIVKVAEAIKDELNAAAAGTFVLAFTAERTCDTEMELADTGTLHVDVIEAASPMGLAGRGSVAFSCRVDIGVRKRFGVDEQTADGRIDLAEVDSLKLLVQQIGMYFVARRLATYNTAVWQSTDVRAIYIPRHLRELRQFTGIVRVEFRTEVELPAGVLS
jgi:hypothetical protein